MLSSSVTLPCARVRCSPLGWTAACDGVANPGSHQDLTREHCSLSAVLLASRLCVVRSLRSATASACQPPLPRFLLTALRRGSGGPCSISSRIAPPHPALPIQDAPAAPKIRIKLRSFEHVNLREAGDKIVEAASRTGASIAGPTPRALPP